VFLCVLCFYIYTVIWAELPEIDLMMMMIMMMMMMNISELLLVSARSIPQDDNITHKIDTIYGLEHGPRF